MANFGWYYRSLENGDFSNVHAENVYASNIFTSNLQASNLGLAAFCNYASPSSDGIITAADYSRWDAGGSGDSNYETLTVGTLTASNIFASNIQAGNLGTAAFTDENDYATPTMVVSLSNAIATSLGSAAYQPTSTWIPSESNVLASAGATGFLSAADWSRFNSGGTVPGTTSLDTQSYYSSSWASVNIPTTNWTDTGAVVTVSPGKWKLDFFVDMSISNTSGQIQLFDATTAIGVPDSLIIASNQRESSSVIVTFTTTTEIRLQVKRSSSSGSASFSRPSIEAVKLSDFTLYATSSITTSNITFENSNASLSNVSASNASFDILLVGGQPVTGGSTLATVTASLASQYNFVTAANVWATDIPLSVSLSAGTWLLLAIVRGEINSSATFWNMAFRLFNATTGTEVPNSLTGLLNEPQKTGTVPCFSVLTTANTETVRLEGLWWASTGTPLWRYFSAGLARITAVKIG